jgi:hypothetical protein
MNREKLFHLVMHSVDDDLLEEARSSGKRRVIPFRAAAAAIAACLCVAAIGVAWHHFSNSSKTQIPNPVHTTTVAKLTQMGYSLPLPSDAQDAAYSTIDTGENSSTPLAQVTYSVSGREYTCRALKTEAVEDISGIYADWSENLNWKTDDLDMQLRESSKDHTAWVGWFSPEDQTQWCLSGSDGDALSLLHTSQEIVQTLGYEMAVAPDGAKEITYNAQMLNGLTVAETSFQLNGIHYAFRTAATSATDDNFADISGTGVNYAVKSNTQVSWCPARLYYNEGGSGKIVWFDVVPGLLYSLSMDTGASQTALTDMAGQLFHPAQGDVG